MEEEQTFEKKYKPQDIMKKRRVDEKQRESMAKNKLERKKAARVRPQKSMVRLEKLVAGNRIKQKQFVEYKRRAKKVEKRPIDLPNSKVLLLIRIRDTKQQTAPAIVRILKLFRLHKIYSAVFLKVNKKTFSLLKTIEPYVTYGVPSRKTIQELITRRAHPRVEKKREPLNSNQIVEKHLGSHGIICIEDLIHEIATCGKHFSKVSKFIWNFRLSRPKEGFLNKPKPFVEGGDWGNREEKINDLLQLMI